MALRVIIALVISTTAGCSILPRSWRRQHHFPPSELHSDSPVHQVQAIHECVERKDVAQVPVLLDLMMDEEPSIRNHAYWGVTQLTGMDRAPASIGKSGTQYHYYDSPEDRKKAVDEWRAYWIQKRASP